MGARPYCRFGHVDLFQIVELHNSMSREGSKTDMLQPPISVSFVASRNRPRRSKRREGFVSSYDYTGVVLGQSEIIFNFT